MRSKTPSKRVLFPSCLKLARLGVFTASLIVLSTFFATLVPHTTKAAADSTVNFQARLMTSAGAIVPDGNYNIEFKLYNVSSGGTALWTETRISTDKVTVANGYLTVNLGSVNAFPTTINWDQDLYLSLNIGGTGSPSWDGEMSPRLHLTAVPYAFRAGQLATLQGGNTSTLSFASQTGANSILLPNESGTLCIQSSTNCGFALASGSGNYIQNGTSPQTANFNITGTGVAATLQAATIDTASGVVLNIGTTNATSITLQKDTTLAAGKNLTFASGAGNFDQSNSTGTFATGTGTVSLNGNTSVANNKSFTANGSALFKDATNAVGAFQIQNSNANQVLTVDTTTSNLLTNSSFETSTTGWSTKGSASFTPVTTQQYDGNQALSVTTPGANGGASYAYSLASSTQYTFSVFAKGGTSFTGIEIGRSENGSTDSSCATSQAVGTTWKRYTCTFTTGTVSGSTYLYVKQVTDATARTFYVDGVQLETGATATPYRGAKTSLDGSLLVNGGQLQASNSNWALQVNALSGGNGVLINGNGDNNLFENALVVAHPDGTNLLSVNEPLHSTILNGGSSLLASAALQVNTIDPGAVAIKATGISGQTADILDVTNSSSAVLFGVGATGNTTVKTATNSTGAFQVQNSAGSSVLAVSTSPNTTNLVTNGSFEGSGTTGWNAKGSVTLSNPTSQQVYGDKSLGITTTTTAGDGVKYPVTLTNGQQYILTFYAKLSSGSWSGFNFGYSQDGSTEDAAGLSTTFSQVFTGGWTRYQLTFTPSAVSGTPYLYFKQAGGAVRTFYLDGVDLEAQSTSFLYNDYRDGNVQLNGTVTSPLSVQPASTTNAFDVTDATGAAAFTVDTFNRRVGIGLAQSLSATLEVSNASQSAPALKVYSTTSTGSQDLLQISNQALNSNNLIVQVTNSGSFVQRNASNSTAAFQVQNSSGNSIFTVDSSTATGQIILGKASTNNGQMTFQNSSNSNTAAIKSGATSSTYTLTLPTTLGSSGDCLKQSNGTGTLAFSACSTTTLQNAYDNSSSPASILLASGKDLQITAQDAATDPNVLVQLQCTTSCGSNGRFAIQTGASPADFFTVNPNNTIVIGSSTNNITFASDGSYTLNGSARRTRMIWLLPEYAGATMTGDGSNNSGTMTSDNTTADPFRNYYRWTTTQGTAQDYDIWVKVPLPSDFAAFPSGQTICMDTYASATTANTVTLKVYDADHILDATSDLTPTATNSWQNKCTSALAGSYYSDGVLTLDIKMTAPASTGDVRVSNISFSYLSKW